MWSQADAVIKTTAKIQEAPEPPRQKPIIKLDGRQQHELAMAHVNEAHHLASSIRASIDSGRDNPFRPDGEIYKLTNPIVDYYKFGPNQSRAATPSYAELDYFSSKNKRKRRAEARRKAKEDQARRPCWRRWLCCCCSRCCDSPGSAAEAGRTQQGGSPAPASSTDRFPHEPKLQEGDTVKIIEAGEQSAGADAPAAVETDLRQASRPTGGGKLKTKNDANKTRNKAKQQKTKKVSVLDGDPAGQVGPDGCSAAPKTEDGPPVAQVKTVKTNRCVIC